MDQFCGTLEKGKLANFFVIDGNTYFSKDPVVHSTWIQGHPFLHYPQERKAESNDKKVKKIEDKAAAKFPTQFKKAIQHPSSVLFSGFKLWTCEKERISLIMTCLSKTEEFQK